MTVASERVQSSNVAFSFTSRVPQHIFYTRRRREKFSQVVFDDRVRREGPLPAGANAVRRCFSFRSTLRPLRRSGFTRDRAARKSTKKRRFAVSPGRSVGLVYDMCARETIRSRYYRGDFSNFGFDDDDDDVDLSVRRHTDLDKNVVVVVVVEWACR